MKLWQKTLMFVTSCAMVLTFAACNREEEEIPYTFEEIIATYASDTNLDEIMALDYSIYTSDGEEKTQPFMDSVVKLEDYLSVINDLSELKISTDKYDFETARFKHSPLSTDEVKLLIESYKKGELTDNDKKLVHQELIDIYNEYQHWVNYDGLDISEELLKRVIKGATCEVAGLEPEDYKRCTIYDLKPDGGYNIPIANIKIDGIAGARSLYTINLNSNSLRDAHETLCAIQGDEAKTLEEINGYCEDSLYYAKIATAAGVELDNRKIIRAEDKNKDVVKSLQRSYEG